MPEPQFDYRAAFMNAAIGICVSEHRFIVRANDAMAAVFGYTRVRLDGMTFANLYPTKEEFARIGSRITPIMNDKGYYSDQRIMRRADGTLFWCHVSGRALDRGVPESSIIWTLSVEADAKLTRTPTFRCPTLVPIEP